MIRLCVVLLLSLTLAVPLAWAADPPQLTVNLQNNGGPHGVNVRVTRLNVSGGRDQQISNTNRETGSQTQLDLGTVPGIYRVVVSDATPIEESVWQEHYFYFDGKSSKALTFDAGALPRQTLGVKNYVRLAHRARADGNTQLADDYTTDIENIRNGNQAAAQSFDQAVRDHQLAGVATVRRIFGPEEASALQRDINRATTYEDKLKAVSDRKEDMQEAIDASRQSGFGVNPNAEQGLRGYDSATSELKFFQGIRDGFQGNIREANNGLNDLQRGTGSTTPRQTGQTFFGDDGTGWKVGFRHNFAPSAEWQVDGTQLANWASDTNPPFIVQSPDKPSNALLLTQTSLRDIKEWGGLRFNYSFDFDGDGVPDMSIPFRLSSLAEGDRCLPGDRTFCFNQGDTRTALQWGSIKGESVDPDCRIDISGVVSMYKVTPNITASLRFVDGIPVEQFHTDNGNLILGLDIPTKECLGTPSGLPPHDTTAQRVVTPIDYDAIRQDTQFHSGTLRNLGPERTLVLIRPIRGVNALVDRGVLNRQPPYIGPLANVERVEVLRGAASPVYGSDAVAGVVNFVTADEPSTQRRQTQRDFFARQFGFRVPITADLGVRLDSIPLPDADYGTVPSENRHALDLNDCGCTWEDSLDLNIGAMPWLEDPGVAPTGPFFSVGGFLRKGSGDQEFDVSFLQNTQVDIFSLGEGIPGQLQDVRNNFDRDIDISQGGGSAKFGLALPIGNSAIAPYVKISGGRNKIDIDTEIQTWDFNGNVRRGFLNEKLRTTTIGADVGFNFKFPLFTDRLFADLNLSAGLRRMNSTYKADSCLSQDIDVPCGAGNVFFNEQGTKRSGSDVGFAGSVGTGLSYYFDSVALMFEVGGQTTPGVAINYPTQQSMGVDLETKNALGWYAGFRAKINASRLLFD